MPSGGFKTTNLFSRDRNSEFKIRILNRFIYSWIYLFIYMYLFIYFVVIAFILQARTNIGHTFHDTEMFLLLDLGFSHLQVQFRRCDTNLKGNCLNSSIKRKQLVNTWSDSRTVKHPLQHLICWFIWGNKQKQNKNKQLPYDWILKYFYV